MNSFSRWFDRHVGLIFAILVLLALFVLFVPLHGQTAANAANVPVMLPGDVLYIDTKTSSAYLLWHAASKHYEIIAPFTQDQAFNLLLAREGYCWSVMHEQAKSTVKKPDVPDIPRAVR